ncbi:unnamed protein product [Ranitomeya imitator]|uniref:NAD kinase 2, mitochondrial n=1 Tax=Ranitomeya imitator TaxID=111125 RepID=A0ABN9M6S4_9NEOB|nr:unnamed protein product [Ranitomeya imitator]
MLLAASKVLDKSKPVIGVNTDPERSEGHLCLPVRYTRSFPEALHKLYRGEFRWQWRQRIRLFLEGTGINLTPVDLHEQQLSLEQHSKAHSAGGHPEQTSATVSGPHLLPVRALNEVFIGESLSSSHWPKLLLIDFLLCSHWLKLLLTNFLLYSRRTINSANLVLPSRFIGRPTTRSQWTTGLGEAEELRTERLHWDRIESLVTSYNINKMAPQTVEEILHVVKCYNIVNRTLDSDLIQQVTNEYNDSLIFSPEEQRMFFSVREPIANRVFSSSRQRGFTSKVSVRSRCWDACMVVDGGTSFEFNDGAVVTISTDGADALCTVLLDE